MYLNFFPKQYFDSHCGALCIVDKASAYGAKGPGFTTRCIVKILNLYTESEWLAYGYLTAFLFCSWQIEIGLLWHLGGIILEDLAPLTVEFIWNLWILGSEDFNVVWPAQFFFIDMGKNMELCLYMPWLGPGLLKWQLLLNLSRVIVQVYLCPQSFIFLQVVTNNF